MVESIARRAFLNFRSSFSNTQTKKRTKFCSLHCVNYFSSFSIWTCCAFHAALGIYFDRNVQKTISSPTHTQKRGQQINIMLFVHQMYKFDRSFGETKLTNEIRKFRLFYERKRAREREEKRNRMMTIEMNERANKERVLLCALIVYYESASEPKTDFGVSDFSISKWSVHAISSNPSIKRNWKIISLVGVISTEVKKLYGIKMRVKRIKQRWNAKNSIGLNLSPLLNTYTQCSEFGDLNTKKIIGITF